MGWVTEAIEELSQGRSVQIRPLGSSMRGRIESGQLVTLVPAEPSSVDVDDVVFVRWKGSYLLHLAKAIEGDRVLIGNNRGKVNGWVPKSDIVAKATEVQN